MTIPEYFLLTVLALLTISATTVLSRRGQPVFRIMLPSVAVSGWIVVLAFILFEDSVSLALNLTTEAVGVLLGGLVLAAGYEFIVGRRERERWSRLEGLAVSRITLVLHGVISNTRRLALGEWQPSSRNGSEQALAPIDHLQAEYHRPSPGSAPAPKTSLDAADFIGEIRELHSCLDRWLDRVVPTGNVELVDALVHLEDRARGYLGLDFPSLAPSEQGPVPTSSLLAFLDAARLAVEQCAVVFDRSRLRS